MQGVLLSARDNRMAGIRSARIADNRVGFGGKVIDYFSLAFISPLGADNYSIHTRSITQVPPRA